jgi:hypothetical protein
MVGPVVVQRVVKILWKYQRYVLCVVVPVVQRVIRYQLSRYSVQTAMTAVWWLPVVVALPVVGCIRHRLSVGNRLSLLIVSPVVVNKYKVDDTWVSMDIIRCFRVARSRVIIAGKSAADCSMVAGRGRAGDYKDVVVSGLMVEHGAPDKWEHAYKFTVEGLRLFNIWNAS